MKIGNAVKYLFIQNANLEIKIYKKSALEIAALKTMKYDCNRF